MGDKTHIQYVDASWNFLRGCTRKSPGCVNCYAAHISARFSKPGGPYEGLAEYRDGRPQWSGEVRFVHERISDPLRWKKSRIMFVNSMSDTFHPGVTLEVLNRAFDTMERTPEHTFLLFTKRPERMRVYLAARYGDDGVPSHIWPGTTVESNDYRYRAQILGEIRAAVRFLSCEPLLGDLDLENFLESKTLEGNGSDSYWSHERLVDWVIVGGESGPHARPLQPAWVRNIQKQCEAAGTAFWFKQWGGRRATGNLLDGKLYEERPTPRVAE